MSQCSNGNLTIRKVRLCVHPQIPKSIFVLLIMLWFLFAGTKPENNFSFVVSWRQKIDILISLLFI